MKPTDIITESIEQRELEEAPTGVWKNLKYKALGSALNPFDSRAAYASKAEIAKIANDYAKQYQSHLTNIPGGKSTVAELLKWLEYKKLDTSGAKEWLGLSSLAPVSNTTVSTPSTPSTRAEPTIPAATPTQAQPAQTDRDTARQQIAATQQANAQKAQQDAAIKAAKDAAIAKPSFQRTATDKLAIQRAQQMGIRESVKTRQDSRKEFVINEAITNSTVLTPDMIDKIILRAVRDTRYKQSYQPADVATQVTPQQAGQQARDKFRTDIQANKSSSNATAATTTTSSQTGQQELNDIRRLSGMIDNHEQRIKRLETERPAK